MMKKYTIRTVVTLSLSWVIPMLYRLWNNSPIEYIHPFLYGTGKDGNPLRISIQWYVKDIGELISYSLVMLTVCMILIPVIKHLQEVKWVGHNGLLIFVTVWQRLFQIIFWASVFDLIHYIIAFRQIEIYFLILNGFYFLLSFYYLFKLWRR